jgi:glycosyltransferase involved in cell wall biosynthesis
LVWINTVISSLNDVVIVTDSLAIDGGSAKVALGSAIALAERGVRVTLFSASGEPSTEVSACANLRIVTTGQGDALSSNNRIGGAVRGIWNVRAKERMDALLSTLDPAHTVVHVHGWTKALSSSVIASVNRAKFPIIITLHEYFTACPTGCLYLHRDRKVCTLVPMSASCILKNCDSRNYAIKLYRVLRQLVTRVVARVPVDISAFITVSDFSRKIIAQYLPRQSRFFAVDNPVDAQQNGRARAEANSEFIFIGRLSAEKGGALLAEAARLANVKVVFIGDGPDRAYIESINTEAEFTGWLDPDALNLRMRAARCLVMPSLWYETLGMVVLEAAAAGIPAIVPRDTAAYGLIEPRISGLAFDRGDLMSLVAQLRVCVDSDLISTMSRNAYASFWANPPTLSLHTDGLMRAYKALLEVTAEEVSVVAL